MTRKRIVNATLARGHHADTGCTARNFFNFVYNYSTPNKTVHYYLTGEDDIARFDSQRYRKTALSPKRPIACTDHCGNLGQGDPLGSPRPLNPGRTQVYPQLKQFMVCPLFCQISFCRLQKCYLLCQQTPPERLDLRPCLF